MTQATQQTQTSLEVRINLLKFRFANVSERLELARETYDRELQAFNSEHASLLATISEQKLALAEIDSELREALADFYRVTESKTFDDHLKVRVTKKTVYDEKRAFDWAKETGLALALDRKAFEAIAKSTELDFVETVEQPTGTIGKFTIEDCVLDSALSDETTPVEEFDLRAEVARPDEESAVLTDASQQSQIADDDDCPF